MCALFVMILLAASPSPASEVRANEQIELYPTIGWQIANGRAWEVEIHGCVFKPNHPWMVAVLRDVLKKEIPKGDTECFNRCARPFFYDYKRGRSIYVRVGDKTFSAGVSGGGGHFTARVRIPNTEIERIATPMAGSPRRSRTLSIRAALNPDDSRVFETQAFLLEATGLSVVSDVDDTIRFAGVGSKRAVFRSTFCEPYRPIPHMADLYRSWARNPGVDFHYLSATPWQLFEPVEDFLRTQAFPAGALNLRTFRWRHTNIFNPDSNCVSHKTEQLDTLFNRFPRRQFVLIGDSTERDPEIYAAFARRFRRQVAGILIRDVSGGRPDSPRYQQAFAGLPTHLWTVFRDSADLKQFSDKFVCY